MEKGLWFIEGWGFPAFFMFENGDTNYNVTIYSPQIEAKLSGFQMAFNEV